jgi:hypothetical protein
MSGQEQDPMEAFTSHLVKGEVLRRAGDEPPSSNALEAVLARISAGVTTEAAARKKPQG